MISTSQSEKVLKTITKCLQEELERARKEMILARDSLYRDEAYKHRKVKHYEEILQALDFIQALKNNPSLWLTSCSTNYTIRIRTNNNPSYED